MKKFNRLMVGLMVASRVSSACVEAMAPNSNSSLSSLSSLNSSLSTGFANPNQLIDDNGNTLLHYAAQNNDITLVKVLIKRGAFINKENKQRKTPLDVAQENSDAKKYLRICDNLIRACYNNTINEDVIRKTIADGGDVNVKDDNLFCYTPLHFAAMHRNAEFVKNLIEVGANVNETGEYGRTPLHFAAMGGNTEIVKTLI